MKTYIPEKPTKKKITEAFFEIAGELMTSKNEHQRTAYINSINILKNKIGFLKDPEVRGELLK